MDLYTNLIVKYKGSIQTCFVYLPQPLFLNLTSTKGSYPIKLSWNHRKVFVGASTLRPSPSECLEMSPIFAMCLNIPENVYVTVESQQKYRVVPICSKVFVEPVSLDDWEIIASSAGYLESEILNQVDILQSGHKFPFWIKSQALVHIRVVSSSDNGCEFIRLGRNSSIVVQPPGQSGPVSIPRTIIDSVCLRVNHCPYRIGFNRVAVEQSVFDQLELPPFAFVRLLNGKQEITVQLVISDRCTAGHVLIPPSLRSRLSVQRFDNVIISCICEHPNQVDASNMGSIPGSLVRRTGQIEVRDGQLIDILVDQDVVLIGPDVLVEDMSGNIWNLRAQESVIVLGQQHTLFHIKFLGESNIPDLLVDDPDQTLKCAAFPDLIDSTASSLSVCLRKMPDQDSVYPPLKLPHLRFRSGICFSGSHGIGKSFFLRALARRLLVDQRIVAAEIWISCASISSDKADDIKAIFKSAVNSAISRAPAIIIFDDLDSLLPSPVENDVGTGLRVSQISEYLGDLLIALRSSYPLLPVIWIASSSSYSSIHPALRHPGGFSTEIVLPKPDLVTRKGLFLDYFDSNGIDYSGLDLDLLANESDGFVAQDIIKVVQQAVHAALSEELGADVHIRTSYLRSVLQSFTPRLRLGIDLKVSDVSWADVGGLEEVRSTLKETFELPARYPFLFEQSPLKLRSGLLLYGPPGCGKTLIASAVARECGLNFISVKGPELLNKYIGASEQAVREQFNRAAAAAPCILFFDEFESIAPRRGADSTGVTDRVVNQMLCHLDGVELRTGVYVLAATSRPDLLDPALLRPGRFDKCLYCGIPDLEARLSILKALCRKMNIDPDLDLESIARRTSNYTGADLQGLLNSAQIAAVHEAIEQRSSHAAISLSHIDDAIRNSRLSVSLTERHRFTSIYAAFMGSKLSDFSLQLREGKISTRTAVK